MSVNSIVNSDRTTCGGHLLTVTGDTDRVHRRRADTENPGTLLSSVVMRRGEGLMG